MSVQNSVQVTNVNLFVTQMNSAGSLTGMAPLPPGTSVATAAQSYEQSLMKTLTAQFATQFPNATISGTDNGYMGPLSAVQPGQAPPCVVTQVNEDLGQWNMPTTSTIGTTIATAIARGIVDQGGVTNFAHGIVQINSNEIVVWMAGYCVYNVTQNEQGVIYLFMAGM